MKYSLAIKVSNGGGIQCNQNKQKNYMWPQNHINHLISFEKVNGNYGRGRQQD